MAGVLPAHASTLIGFDDILGNAMIPLAGDRYRSEGVILGTTSSNGLCTEDFPGSPGFSLHMFTCGFVPSTLTFDFVDPTTLAPLPSNLFGLKIAIDLVPGPGTPWALSLFDVNNNLLEFQSEAPDNPVFDLYTKTILISRPQFDIARAEFVTSTGTGVLTGVDDLRFNQVPEPSTFVVIGLGLILLAWVRRLAIVRA